MSASLKPWVVVLAALTLLGVACDDEPTPRSTAPDGTPSASVSDLPSPSPSPSPSVACPEQLGAASASPEGAFEGLIDADESDDTAYLFDDDSAAGDCKLLLVIETAAGGTHSAPILGPGGGVGPVVIRYLARIDERPGAEIVVRTVTGASTEFFALFSLGGGALEQIEIEGADAYGDLFPSGGSVGHLEASDCISGTGDDGYVVVSLATPQGDGYRLVRTFYTSSAGVFSTDEVIRERIDDPQDLEIYQEFFGTPFGGCAAGT